jgi:hypothetical protein
VKRHLHSSISARKDSEERQEVESEKKEEEMVEELAPFDSDDLLKSFSEDQLSNESTSAGHLKMRQDRHLLYYLRLIEQVTPELVGMWDHSFASFIYSFTGTAFQR